MARMRSLRSKSSTVKTLARCADGSIPRARVDAVAFFFVADAAGGDGDGHAGFLGVLADEVFADGGAADIAGADSHDSVHGSSVSVG